MGSSINTNFSRKDYSPEHIKKIYKVKKIFTGKVETRFASVRSHRQKEMAERGGYITGILLRNSKCLSNVHREEPTK